MTPGKGQALVVGYLFIGSFVGLMVLALALMLGSSFGAALLLHATVGSATLLASASLPHGRH